MSLLNSLIHQAAALGASDLHLEPGLPPAVRVNGQLRTLEGPLGGQILAEEAARLLPDERWTEFLERHSADLSLVISGVRCRVHVLRSARGVGFSIRLLRTFQATLESLNLHADLLRLVQRSHGLVLVTGPTGSGKSSTIAALVEELNRSSGLHVITLEQPIEHTFRPRRCFIRQREVGRDTPSFHQGLLDALREDPDVLVVGEVRDPDDIRLALTAAETGHLVITTLHAGSAAEALARVVGSFAPESQPGITAALAETLIGVVSQRLYWRADLGLRLPECEVLTSTDAAKAMIRQGAFGRLASVIQMGGGDGMWSFDRWRRWQDGRERYFTRAADAAREPLPEAEPAPELRLPERAPAAARPALPRDSAPAPAADPLAPRPRPPLPPPRPRAGARAAPRETGIGEDGVLVLDDHQDDLAAVLRELK